MRDTKMTALQKIALNLGILYILFVIVLTVYNFAVEINHLPQVAIAVSDNGVLPIDCLQGNFEIGYYIYKVEQQDGPWGKRYVAQKMQVYYVEQKEDSVIIYELENTPTKVIRQMNFDIYDGMEIYIQSEK